MRRPDQYAYALARVYAKRSYMLKPADYEAMAKAISYHQALRHLSTTFYAKYVAGTEELPDVERGLALSYNELFDEVSRFVSGKPRAFLELVKYRHELEVLKALLRAKFAEVPKNEALRNVVPLGKFNQEFCEKLLGARDVTTAISLIQDEALRSTLLSALKEAEELKNPYPIEVAVDKYVYQLLGKTSGELGGLDREWIKKLLGEEVDTKNLMICLRLKSMGVKDPQIYLLPYKYRFTVERATRVMAAPTVGEALAAVRDLIGEVKYTSLSDVEGYLLKRLASINASVFLHYGFHLGLLFALLNLKFFELRNLKALLIGKSEGLPGEEILSRLILHQGA